MTDDPAGAFLAAHERRAHRVPPRSARPSRARSRRAAHDGRRRRPADRARVCARSCCRAPGCGATSATRHGGPDRAAAGRPRRPAARRPEGRAYRSPIRASATPAGTTCTPRSCSAPALALAEIAASGRAARPGAAGLPAGRGGHARRRARRDRGRAGGPAALALALHCDPSLEVGTVGLRTGPITAASDMITCVLSGPGGHTSRPHNTVDLVYALGRLLTDLPAALTRVIDPRAAVTLVWGHGRGRLGGQRDPADRDGPGHGARARPRHLGQGARGARPGSPSRSSRPTAPVWRSTTTAGCRRW